MLNCDGCQNLMADALFGDLEVKSTDRMNAHLQDCNDCQNIFQEMVKARENFRSLSYSHPHFGTGATMSADAENNLTEKESSGADVWQRLQPELDRIDAERFRNLPRTAKQNWLRYGVAIAASIVLMVAVITNLILPDAEQKLPELVSAEPLNRINPDLVNYLDRAQVMLQLVANTQLEDSAALPIRKNYAEFMAMEANLLRASVEETSNAGQLSLLLDVQFMLLQISNLDESNMAAGIEILQQYLEENIVLFRIGLLEMRKEMQGQPVSDVI